MQEQEYFFELVLIQKRFQHWCRVNSQNVSDGTGGSTEQKITIMSLQLMTNNQILAADAMFNFSTDNWKELNTFMFQSEEILKHRAKLQTNFKVFAGWRYMIIPLYSTYFCK